MDAPQDIEIPLKSNPLMMIFAPKSGVSGKTVTLPFQDLSGMDVTAVAGQKVRMLLHPGGKLNIAAQSLPKGTTVEERLYAIRERKDMPMGGKLTCV